MTRSFSFSVLGSVALLSSALVGACADTDSLVINMSGRLIFPNHMLASHAKTVNMDVAVVGHGDLYVQDASGHQKCSKKDVDISGTTGHGGDVAETGDFNTHWNLKDGQWKADDCLSDSSAGDKIDLDLTAINSVVATMRVYANVDNCTDFCAGNGFGDEMQACVHSCGTQQWIKGSTSLTPDELVHLLEYQFGGSYQKDFMLGELEGPFVPTSADLFPAVVKGIELPSTFPGLKPAAPAPSIASCFFYRLTHRIETVKCFDGGQAECEQERIKPDYFDKDPSSCVASLFCFAYSLGNDPASVCYYDLNECETNRAVQAIKSKNPVDDRCQTWDKSGTPGIPGFSPI
ncbi:hypothetical protein WDW37_08640 [Bdellovibrionota bacterium FG-1]